MERFMRYDGEKFFMGLDAEKQAKLTAAYDNFITENSGFDVYNLMEMGLFPDTDGFNTISLRELLEATEVVEQSELQESSVLSILNGQHGVLKGNPIYTFLEVAHTQGNTVILSGRHRVTALAVLGYLAEMQTPSDFDYDAFIQQPIPVIVRRYDPALILAANGSRTMRAIEKMSIAAQVGGIDTNDVTALLESTADGSFPKGFALALAGQNEHNLSPNTMLSVANSFVSKLKAASKLGAKLTKRFETLEVLYEVFPLMFTAALEQEGFLQDGEVTGNVARAATQLGEATAKLTLAHDEVGKYLAQLLKAEKARAKTSTRKRTRTRQRPTADPESDGDGGAE
jgi:hypothetical protein